MGKWLHHMTISFIPSDDKTHRQILKNRAVDNRATDNRAVDKGIHCNTLISHANWKLFFTGNCCQIYSLQMNLSIYYYSITRES